MTQVQLFHWLIPIFHSLNRNSFILHAQKKILFSQTLTNYPTKSSVHHLQTCFGLIIKQLLQPSTLVGSVHRSQPPVQNVTAHFARRKKICRSENLLSQPSMCVHLLYISFSCILFYKILLCLSACLLSSQVLGASVFHEYNTYRTVVMFITNRDFCTSSSHNNRLLRRQRCSEVATQY